MLRSFSRLQGTFGAAAVLAALALPAGPATVAAGNDEGATVKPVAVDKLPNVPGKSITAVVVTYAPGAKSEKHHHAGSVFAYVLSGAIRSQSSGTGAAKVYAAGESFFEPPGSEHLVSENASATEPASLLAVFVADDGAADYLRQVSVPTGARRAGRSLLVASGGGTRRSLRRGAAGQFGLP